MIPLSLDEFLKIKILLVVIRDCAVCGDFCALIKRIHLGAFLWNGLGVSEICIIYDFSFGIHTFFIEFCPICDNLYRLKLNIEPHKLRRTFRGEYLEVFGPCAFKIPDQCCKNLNI